MVQRWTLLVFVFLYLPLFIGIGSFASEDSTANLKGSTANLKDSATDSNRRDEDNQLESLAKALITGLNAKDHYDNKPTSPAQLRENYLWTFFTPRRASAENQHLYPTTYSEHPAKIALADKLFALPRDSKSLLSYYETLKPISKTLLPTEAFIKRGYAEAIEKLLASYVNIRQTPNWQELFKQIERKLPQSTGDLAEGYNQHGCALWADFSLVDCGDLNLWYSSFWFRRWQESNIDAVNSILESIVLDYLPKSALASQIKAKGSQTYVEEKPKKKGKPNVQKIGNRYFAKSFQKSTDLWDIVWTKKSAIARGKLIYSHPSWSEEDIAFEGEVLAIVGPYLSVKKHSIGYHINGRYFDNLSFETRSMETGKLISLRHLFNDEALFNAFMSNDYVIKSIQTYNNEGNKSFNPKTLDALLSSPFAGCANGLSENILTSFTFYQVKDDQVVIRIRANGCGPTSHVSKQIGLLLPIPKALASNLTRADENNYLMNSMVKLGSELTLKKAQAGFAKKSKINPNLMTSGQYWFAKSQPLEEFSEWDIQWSTGSAMAGQNVLYSAVREDREVQDFEGQVLSIVGPYISSKIVTGNKLNDKNQASNTSTKPLTRYETRLIKDGKLVSLVDIFGEKRVYEALIKDSFVLKSLKDSSLPANLKSLTTALSRCEVGFNEAALSQFVFHHLKGEQVAVRLGLNTCGAHAGRFIQLGMYLSILPNLQDAFQLAQKQQLLMTQMSKLYKD